MVIVFEGMELDTSLFELRRGDERVPLEPQAFDVLVYLLRHRDRVVSKEELMDQVWGGRFVTETAVTSRIKQVRRAVGDSGDAQRIVRTVHGRGYRFVAPAREVGTADARAASLEARAAPPSDAAAPVRYTESDRLQIAYQVTGGGDLDIVLVPGFISHLEQDWGDPRHAHFLQRLGTLGRLIRFDKRGTGMSDRPPGLPDLETRMHDVLAVMDAVGSTRAVLLGYSEGGPMACLFAAAHPERVSGLVLYGSYAKRRRSDDYPWAPDPAERARYLEYLVTTWDWEGDIRLRCPSADDAMAAWWARRSRAATTPTTLRALISMNDLVDVRDLLPAVRVPTLVVHRRGDRLARIEDGRYLAEHIPGARLVELEGEDHFVAGSPDQILDPVEHFLAGLPHPGPATSLALVAIVGVAGAQADGVATRLEAAGGRRRSAQGGRILLLFDGPATAVRAGAAALAADPRATASLAVHVAEVDREAAVLGGFGVSTALALADAAPRGAVWTSATVKDLMSGSGVSLEPVGVRRLAGLGEQQVFRAASS